jgi:hypothetical protein
VEAFEHLAGGDRQAAAVNLNAGLGYQDDILALINQAVTNGEITPKYAKTLNSTYNKMFSHLQYAYYLFNDQNNPQSKLTSALAQVNKDDTQIHKTISKLGANQGVITLAETPATAGFHKPGTLVHYVIKGLPADCCANNCVEVTFKSTALDLGYSPVVPQPEGSPSCGKFSVRMGPDMGGVFVIVKVNGKEYKRGLFNYGGKTKYKTTDYLGCYQGSASGCITAHTPEGDFTACASYTQEFCLDKKGIGQGTAGDYGNFNFKINPQGIIKGGSIVVDGGTFKWSGSSIIGRGGLVYMSGTWSFSAPGLGEGSGKWSVEKISP